MIGVSRPQSKQRFTLVLAPEIARTSTCSEPQLDPRPNVGPPEGRVFRPFHDGGLVAPSGLISEIGTLWPIEPCGRSSL